MRVTNMMTTNQLLLNLNKSMNSLSFLQYQAETGNKIRYASDNPIIAGRSLKFRTNIVETEQYLSNVDQGRSWLNSTANAVKNVIEALSSSADNSVRSLLVGASNGTYTTTDSKIFANQLRETLNEIMGELNVTYAGRYVFSGYKTDEKPLFDTDQPKLTMDINQNFNLNEVNTDYRVYVKTKNIIDVDGNKVPTQSPVVTGGLDQSAMPQEISVIRLKLPYDVGIDNVDIPGFSGTITEISSGNPNAYFPAAGEINFIKETGELIFSKGAYDTIKATEVGAQFDTAASDVLNAFGTATTIGAAKAALEKAYDLLNSVKGASDVDYLVEDAIQKMQKAINDSPDHSDAAAFTTPVSVYTAMDDASNAIAASTTPVPLNINYTKTGFKAGEINPKAYFTCSETLSNGTTKRYNMDNQAMMYEFSINNKMKVNALAKDVLTPSMLNDILDAVKFVENIKLSDYDELVGNGLSPEQAQQQIDNETKFYTDLISKKFTQLIGKVDDHSLKISVENTSIGSRLQRLNLISNRLQDDRLNFEDLKSANDYVDASEVYVRYTSMLSVYQSALQTGAKIVQMSLVNFI